MNQSSAVLLVEDNLGDRILALKALRTSTRNLTVHCAANGTEALSLIATYDFDLVLLDLNLPDISGTELLPRLRTQSANTATRICVLSTSRSPNDIAISMQQGATAYEIKPRSYSDYGPVVEKIEWLLSNVSSPSSVMQ